MKGSLKKTVKHSYVREDEGQYIWSQFKILW